MKIAYRQLGTGHYLSPEGEDLGLNRIKLTVEAIVAQFITPVRGYETCHKSMFCSSMKKKLQ